MRSCAAAAETRCWACSVRVERVHGGSGGLSAFDVYETAVEVVESLRGPFALADVWALTRRRLRNRDLGKRALSYLGVVAHTYARYALHDMAAHGLVRCARRDSRGARCLQWEVAS